MRLASILLLVLVATAAGPSATPRAEPPDPRPTGRFAVVPCTVTGVTSRTNSGDYRTVIRLDTRNGTAWMLLPVTETGARWKRIDDLMGEIPEQP